MGYGQSEDWEFHPLEAGATGQAFMGVKSDEKVFFKRNTSPFIAALSAEGIVPKLMWTQRTYSGDILTAQEWKDGQLLDKEEMASLEVCQLIHKIHHSTNLFWMLRKVDGHVFRPLDFIDFYFSELPTSLQNNQFLNQVVAYLEDSIEDYFYQVDYTVCHGDLNHHNFLRDQEDYLYLVDWENVRIADPLSDLTFILCQYLNPTEWTDWLNQYGLTIDKETYTRIRWYSLVNCLLAIKQYYMENRHYKVNETILLIKRIYQENHPS
ncbi:phosphotransferase family protein [Vaginisenegalia massiliensis]|uniref:phosphotransferase family protein n=1 Tax=Vaginisenegalia massiliensis TaxID=2058294 RepID=UPI000F540CB2|nr:phosphotransferase family protein [Vaginisenegalia massiliensis]